MKILAQIAELCLRAFMSLRPCVLAPLRTSAFCLCLYVDRLQAHTSILGQNTY